MINNFLRFANEKDIEKKYVRVSREQVGKLLRGGFSPICVDENTNEYLFYSDNKLKSFMEGESYANA